MHNDYLMVYCLSQVFGANKNSPSDYNGMIKIVGVVHSVCELCFLHIVCS